MDIGVHNPEIWEKEFVLVLTKLFTYRSTIKSVIYWSVTVTFLTNVFSI